MVKSAKEKKEELSTSEAAAAAAAATTTVESNIKKKAPTSVSGKKKKKEKAFSQFITDVLPSLKKEMVRKKKEPFDWDRYSHYFKPDSGYMPTFILPLFRFLLADEIICDRYGNFDNKHRVKTAAGHKRVMDLSEHNDILELTPEMLHYFARRFGVEWFKIPSKDGFRAKSAAAAGHEGQFKIILTGLYEDSFTDSATGQEVVTINPILMYEPVLPPPPKKERKAPPPKKSSSSSSSSNSSSSSSSPQPSDEVSSAQEVPVDKLPEFEEDSLEDDE